jgi:hypothetical protein
MMAEAKTFTGGCHCGRVRYEFTGDLAMVLDCNCSVCMKKGLLLTFVDTGSFNLRSGADVLKEYRFNRNIIGHQFCTECGVQPFANGQMPDGTKKVAVNVATIDDVDLSKLTLTPFDGKNM